MRAAEKGYRPAQKSLASVYAGRVIGKKSDIEKSLYWYSKWAKSGDANNQLEFSKILDTYPFFKMKDQLELKRKWLTMAAKNGSAEAMLNLGHFIRNNEKDEKTALNWYIKSANKGYDRGQLAAGLALLHENDTSQAVKWLELAATNGNRSAQTELGQIYEGIDPLNQQRAFFWYQKAAVEGDPYAAYRVCHYLHNGITVTKNNIVAWAWCSLGMDATPDSRDERDVIEKELSASDLQKAKAMYGDYKLLYDKANGS